MSDYLICLLESSAAYITVCIYIYIYVDVGRGMVPGYEAPPFKEKQASRAL